MSVQCSSKNVNRLKNTSESASTWVGVCQGSKLTLGINQGGKGRNKAGMKHTLNCNTSLILACCTSNWGWRYVAASWGISGNSLVTKRYEFRYRAVLCFEPPSKWDTLLFVFLPKYCLFSLSSNCECWWEYRHIIQKGHFKYCIWVKPFHQWTGKLPSRLKI